MNDIRRRSVRLPVAVAAGVAVLGLTPTATTSAFAEEGPPTDVVAKVTGQVLDVRWTPTDAFSSFIVVDDRLGTVVQTGAQTTLSRPLVSGIGQTLSLYGVGPLGASTDLIATVRAIVPVPDPLLPAVTAVTTDEATTLQWTGAPSVETWAVASPSGTTSVGSAELASLPVTLADTADLQLVGDQPGADGVVDDSITGLALAPLEDASTALLAPDSEVGAVVSAQRGIGGLQSTAFKYDAYIPMQYIDAPDTGSGLDCESGDGSDYWYGGDDRGPDFENSHYRTRAVAKYGWGTQNFTSQNLVSATHRYIHYPGGAYVLESQRTASKSGSTVTRTFGNANEFAATVAHTVGNPYCAAMNSIDYDLQARSIFTGYYDVQGQHDRMPNHQLYVRYVKNNGDVAMRMIFHHSLTNPKCLNPAYAAWYCPPIHFQYTS